MSITGAPCPCYVTTRNLMSAPARQRELSQIQSSKSSAEATATATADSLEREDIKLRDSMRRHDGRLRRHKRMFCLVSSGRRFKYFAGLRLHTCQDELLTALGATMCDISAARATWERRACARYVFPSASLVPCARKSCGTGI
jgi:hypothetical protein